MGEWSERGDGVRECRLGEGPDNQAALDLVGQVSSVVTCVCIPLRTEPGAKV